MADSDAIRAAREMVESRKRAYGHDLSRAGRDAYMVSVAAAALLHEYDALAARVAAHDEFLGWLTSMDDPEDVVGREERRTVTLTRIIDRAAALRGEVPG
jgi:hypothetical protein